MTMFCIAKGVPIESLQKKLFQNFDDQFLIIQKAFKYEINYVVACSETNTLPGKTISVHVQLKMKAAIGTESYSNFPRVSSANRQSFSICKLLAID